MNTLEIYNYLSGKNLCNLFANLVVKELSKNFPDVNTEITVVNVRNFFIVKGSTNSNEVLQLNNLFNEYIKNLTKTDNFSFSVIDTINYSSTFEPKVLSISDVLTKNDEFENLKSFVDSHAKKELYFNIKINNHLKVVYFDCESNHETTVYDLLKDKFNDYQIVKKDFSNEVYMSDKIYGLSVNKEKLYHLLFKNIFNHLYSLGICKYLDYNLFSNNSWEDIDNLNVDLKISNEKLIVKNEWLESFILDVFPFDTKTIGDLFSSTDLSKIITDNDYTDLNKLHKLSEFVLY